MHFILEFQETPFFAIDQMDFFLCFILVNHCTGLLFSQNFLIKILITSTWFTKFFLFSFCYDILISSLFFISFIISSTYLYEKKLHKEYLIKNIFSEEHEKTEQLLTQMMPPHVLKNLEEEVSTTDKLNQVTVMYADIVGFTAWSSNRSPNEVVGMLSELFTRFDKMCVEYNVYKVHTIGDCYVAMGFKDKNQRNPAKEALNVIRFACSLISAIEEVNEMCGCQLKMRIGIHTGEVIGGITGTNVVRYDIYGKDVLIANKMESYGEPGKIAVSQLTKELIEDYSPGEIIFNFFKETKVQDENINMYLAIDSRDIELNQ
jgi:class 3 adenylate cyclase